MRIQFYKPNPKVTGSAASFNTNAKGELWLQMIKQASWDNQTKRGSFAANSKDRDKTVGLKFNAMEAASFIDVIERNSEFSSVHSVKTANGQSITNFRFCPYIAKDTNEQKGFSLSVFKNKNNFIIGFTFAEAVLVKTFMKKFIEQSFDGIAEDGGDAEIPNPRASLKTSSVAKEETTEESSGVEAETEDDSEVPVPEF